MRIVRIALISLAVLYCVPLSQAADTIYMTVDGVTCSSPGKGPGDGMKVLSWQMGVEQALDIGTGSSGGGAGKATFEPLTVTRAFDECSPLLLPKLFTGTVLNTVTLTQYGTPAGGEGAPVPLMVVTLTTAAISNYTIGGDANRDPAETWTFKVGKVCIKNVTNSAQACWNFLTNSGT